MEIIKVGDSTFLPLSSVQKISFDRTEETQVGRRRASVQFVNGTSEVFESCPKATEDSLHSYSSYKSC